MHHFTKIKSSVIVKIMDFTSNVFINVLFKTYFSDVIKHEFVYLIVFFFMFWF